MMPDPASSSDILLRCLPFVIMAACSAASQDDVAPSRGASSVAGCDGGRAAIEDARADRGEADASQDGGVDTAPDGGGAVDDADADAAANEDTGRCAFQRGWTREVRGGLGGRVLRVTTLARRGPGSLQEALAASGPRVVVFEVGGVIDLEAERLTIDEPFVTVAGQTAPSPGITLIRGGLVIATHDVVVQHLRVRPGSAGQPVGWKPDAISVDAAHDVIVDHCSTTWAIDENLSASGPAFGGPDPDAWRRNTSHRVTFSSNLVAEPLLNSTHDEGDHGMGTLIHDNVTGVLIYGNVYASNHRRNPFIKGGSRGAIVNNYIVNPYKKVIVYSLNARQWMGKPEQTGRWSVIGNVFHHGLDTKASAPLFRIEHGPLELLLRDNLARDRRGDDVLELAGDLSAMTTMAEAQPELRELDMHASGDLLALLRDDVGARPWDRDAVDARIIAEAWAATTRHIDDQDDVGGYPAAAPATTAPFVAEAWDRCLARIAP